MLRKPPFTTGSFPRYLAVMCMDVIPFTQLETKNAYVGICKECGISAKPVPTPVPNMTVLDTT